MASAWPEDTFVCPVCLETLRDPATLPCGHSYCLSCIQAHWDKGDTQGHSSCPQCRQVFNPRPSLSRSAVLVEAMEKLRANSLKYSHVPATFSPALSMPMYLEVLPDKGPQRQGSIYPELPKEDQRMCPHHKHPLDLFCSQDRECVCSECCVSGHKGHHVVRPEEERRERERELSQMQADVQVRIHQTEEKLRGKPKTVQKHMALLQALEAESATMFAEMVKNINFIGGEVAELLRMRQTTIGSRVEGQIQELEQELAQLHWKNEELSRIAKIQDHTCFLKNCLIMEPLRPMDDTLESGTSQEEAVVESFRSSVSELGDSLQDLCKSSLARVFRIVNDDSMAASAEKSGLAMAQNSVGNNGPKTPLVIGAAHTIDLATAQNPVSFSPVYEMMPAPPPVPPLRPQATPPLPRHHQASVKTPEFMNPEPKTRADLLKFRFEPTMDPNTAFRHLLLSDGYRKATLRAESQNSPNHPERFHFWRQVLCREPLAGSPYYFEVEWTGRKMTIGLTYKDIDRKGNTDQSRLGHNTQSWSLYWSGTGFSFWHSGQETLVGSPKAHRIGVYVDQHAGLMSFYGITTNQANLIYRHQTQFSGPLYPGFRFWGDVKASVTICELS